MPILAAQYLESIPPDLTPQQACDCLRRAFDCAPISHILLGWNVPAHIETAIANETNRHGVKLYQWHPLLTGESDTSPNWHTVNWMGKPIPGFHNLPEFTFLCPNHPDVQNFVSERAEKVIQRGIYQGLFLDRIRFPSPARLPEVTLGCFCNHCRLAARNSGVDLENVRRQISGVIEDNGHINLVQCLFTHSPKPFTALESFLCFRADSITRTVASISKRLQEAGMETGLDCFSPSLTWMVGQDLDALSKISTWIKVMTYPRTYGPAGLPFELLGMLDWLQEREPGSALDMLREISGLDLPQTREDLAQAGLPSSTITSEIETGKKMGAEKLLAGVALVDLPGINMVNINDLKAAQNAEGMVLSWDLWFISPDVLRQIKV
jgi:hypothetical protein